MHAKLNFSLLLILVCSSSQGALAQGDGVEAEVSTHGIAAQWLPCTIVGAGPAGELIIRLDTETGPKTYTVQSRWVRGTNNKRVQQVQSGHQQRGVQQPGSAQQQQSNQRDQVVPRPPLVQQKPPMSGLVPATTDGSLGVGDLVDASPLGRDDQWYMGQVIDFYNGNPVVRLVRPGMPRPEDLVISRQWVKRAGAAPARSEK